MAILDYLKCTKLVWVYFTLFAYFFIHSFDALIDNHHCEQPWKKTKNNQHVSKVLTGCVWNTFIFTEWNEMIHSVTLQCELRSKCWTTERPLKLYHPSVLKSSPSGFISKTPSSAVTDVKPSRTQLQPSHGNWPLSIKAEWSRERQMLARVLSFSLLAAGGPDCVAWIYHNR